MKKVLKTPGSDVFSFSVTQLPSTLDERLKISRVTLGLVRSKVRRTERPEGTSCVTTTADSFSNTVLVASATAANVRSQPHRERSQLEPQINKVKPPSTDEQSPQDVGTNVASNDGAFVAGTRVGGAVAGRGVGAIFVGLKVGAFVGAGDVVGSKVGAGGMRGVNRQPRPRCQTIL